MSDVEFWGLIGPFLLVSQVAWIAAFGVLVLRWEPKR